MIDKKRLLARCLVSGRVLEPLSRLRTAYRMDIPILAYHRVWDVPDEDRFPYDVELVSASIADFQWQMQYVRQNFDPLTFGTLLRILDNDGPLPPRPVIITFDDGFEDNYLHAFPILNALDVPATIFLSTGYIGGHATFWSDRLAHLLLTAPAGAYLVQHLAEEVHISDDVQERRRALGILLRKLKLMPNQQRLDVLHDLDEHLGPWTGTGPAPESRAMNWNQVREMAGSGIEFGSHTVTHPILANLNEDELRFELLESKRKIEEETGQPVSVISYPVGGRTAFNEQVRRAVEAAGYCLGASYLAGTNPLRNLDRFGLRRQHVERYTDRSYFAAMLGWPEIFQ